MAQDAYQQLLLVVRISVSGAVIHIQSLHQVYSYYQQIWWGKSTSSLLFVTTSPSQRAPSQHAAAPRLLLHYCSNISLLLKNTHPPRAEAACMRHCLKEVP